MKLSSVFSYADIVDMRNEGLNDDEIINKAKEKIAYQKSPEYQAKLKAEQIENAKRKDLEKNFANYAISNQDQANLMSGRNTADEIASKYRENIQNYEEKQIYKNQAEQQANSKQKQIANAIETMGGGLGETAVGVAKGATFIPHTIAKALASNSKLAKSFYEKSKQARSNLDKGVELYNARTGQDGKALYKTGEIATEILTDPLTYWMPWMKSAKFAARGAGYALTGGAEGALHEYGSNEKASAEDIAKMGGIGAALGLGGGALIEGAIKGGGALYNKFKNRGAGANAEPNTAPNSSTAPNTAPNTQNSNADDLATNGVWLDYGNIVDVPLNITAIENLKTRQGELNDEIKSANELLKKARTNKTRKRLKEQIKSANDELKTINLELQKPITAEQGAGLRSFDDDGLVRGNGFATDPNSAKAMSADEIAANEAEILGSGKPQKTQKGELVPLKTADIIDLVPDENGVYQVAYNGSSKELAKIATEIAKGEPRSLGAKRLVFIADNIAGTAAKDAEQKISANIAKINDDSVELYANNTALLGEIAKKYPMLSKDEQIELANKQILANASAELLEYSRFLNGGSLPNDARLLGKNAGRMILKSLNAGATPAEVINMLLKAGISGRNSTAAKALIQTGDINAYNAVMRQGEAELIAELSNKVRVAAKNESLGAILNSAKAKALENDKALLSAAKNAEGNSKIPSNEELIESMKATSMEQWSKEQKELFDDMPKFKQDQILDAPKIKHDEEVFGKIPYNELSFRNQIKVIDEAKNSAKGKELQAQYDKLEGAKYTAAEGGKYPSGAQLEKITKAQNKIAAQRDELINTYIKEYDEKVAGNSRIPSDGVAKTAENSIKEAENQANLAEPTAEFSKAYNAIKNIGKYTELLENDYKKIASLNTKDFTQRLKNDIQAYEELAELQEIAYKATNGLLYDDEYVKYFNVKQGQKGYLSKAQSIHDNTFKILDQAPNYISGLYGEISRLKALKSLSKEQDEALKKILKQVNLDAVLDLAGLQNYKLMAIKIKTALNALTKAKKILDETPKSKSQKLKRGFSTQALNELMLGLGSGGANAAAEDDPNKKAEAFIKGFLAGFGGAKAASMLAKNAPKLAPQLARASEKMAADLPRLFNDRPDILGGVLGRMNNPKDKFSFIFGGEKALGANKAKLKVAKDMAKNGAKDDEIWAKTGWYKDIDGKWKFEINGAGGELKELNAPELDEATKIIKRDYFDKQMNLKELYDFTEFKNGYIDFDEIKRFYDLPKSMSKDEFTQKFPYLKMSVNDYMEHGFYKDIDLLHDEIIPARKILNQEYNKTPLNEVLDDPELFASYPQLKDVKVSVDELKSTEKAHFNPNNNEIVLSSAIDAEEMKSSLYHEIQHAVQKIEGFARGGEVGNLNYKKLAGEAESRNVQARLAMLENADKEAQKIVEMIKDPKKAMAVSRDLANVDDYVKLASGDNTKGAIHINLRHTSDPKKLGYVTDDEISRLGENMRKFLLKHKEPYLKDNKFVYEWVENGNAYTLVTDSRSLQLAPFNHTGTPAKDEIITFYSNKNLKTNGAYKFTNPKMTWQNATLPNSQLLHPDKTLDIAPNERIVSFDNSAELSMRESFSPQLKASYGMRDKLLKSTNEVRASLSKKGKAELEKLAGSKDSKLSRDAQIMKTLENAKSNPARYERLKKLYLDKNGKVKDSIGLC